MAMVSSMSKRKASEHTAAALFAALAARKVSKKRAYTKEFAGQWQSLKVALAITQNKIQYAVDNGDEIRADDWTIAQKLLLSKMRTF